MEFLFIALTALVVGVVYQPISRMGRNAENNKKITETAKCLGIKLCNDGVLSPIQTVELQDGSKCPLYTPINAAAYKCSVTPTPMTCARKMTYDERQLLTLSKQAGIHVCIETNSIKLAVLKFDNDGLCKPEWIEVTKRQKPGRSREL